MKNIFCCHSRNVCSSSGQAINIKEYRLLPSIRREICLLNICVGRKKPESLRLKWAFFSQFGLRCENPHTRVDQNQIWGTGRLLHLQLSGHDGLSSLPLRRGCNQARVPFSQHWLFFSSGSEWISDQRPAGFTQLDSRAPIPDMKEECSLTPVDGTEELQPLLVL